MSGPLTGIRILEFAGIGPSPFCGMMLADHGADVIRLERLDSVIDRRDPLLRSRRILRVNLKDAEGTALARAIAKDCDGLIEGFRPGVMERMGLGPDVLLQDNPTLVYGRMTGWGQTGPLARAAGHDINYVALSGTLHACGRDGEKPTPPINLLGDFGGGGMLLAFAMVSALLSVRLGGTGQVIDCAMTEGAALLNAMTWGFRAAGQWQDSRGVNLLDTGAHFYDTYACSDGKFIAVGSIEPQFYGLLREKLGLVDDEAFDDHLNPERWPALKLRLAVIFASRTRDAWCALMEGTDVCFAPVLSMAEAPSHPHNAARGSFIDVDGTIQPAPAPRYSRTQTRPVAIPSGSGQEDMPLLLNDMGYTADHIDALKARRAIA